jgi:hypothetical protein
LFLLAPGVKKTCLSHWTPAIKTGTYIHSQSIIDVCRLSSRFVMPQGLILRYFYVC